MRHLAGQELLSSNQTPFEPKRWACRFSHVLPSGHTFSYLVCPSECSGLGEWILHQFWGFLPRTFMFINVLGFVGTEDGPRLRLPTIPGICRNLKYALAVPFCHPRGPRWLYHWSLRVGLIDAATENGELFFRWDPWNSRIRARKKRAA